MLKNGFFKVKFLYFASILRIMIIFFVFFEIFRTQFFEIFRKNIFSKNLEFFSKKTTSIGAGYDIISSKKDMSNV
jgi:hypothetical protein